MNLNLKNMSEKHLLILTIVTVLVIALALGAVFFLGFLRYRTIKTEIAELQTELDKVRARAKKIEPLKKELKKWAAAAKDNERVLPEHANKEELLEMFAEMKVASNINISSVKINTAATGKRKTRASTDPECLQKVDYEISVHGEYFNLGSFVNMLENYPRFMAVNEFALKEPDNEIHAVTLRGCTYRYVQVEPKQAKRSRRPNRQQGTGKRSK